MAGVLFTGGMKSGKSARAEEYALRIPGPRLYIATAEMIDAETERRVAAHRARRRDAFDTVEEPLRPETHFAAPGYGVVMVDCLTHWYNNLFHHIADEGDRALRLTAFLDALAAAPRPVVLVTNEVGWGVIPDNPLARAYVDFSGAANQQVLARCREAYLVVAGAAVTLKSQGENK